MTEEKQIRILHSAQKISSFAESINIEVMLDITDARFKQQTLKNHVRNLKNASEGIKRELAAIVRVKDREHFDYEFAVEMHRLVSHFCLMSAEQIREIMDGIEEKIKSNDK